jgi:type II secretory pathway pseudopilin PulG
VTLLEVLLVLALLVALASVAWPSLEPALAGVELRKSAERIRVEWNRARVEALTEGSVVLFRYEPQGNHYSLERQPEPEYIAGSMGADASAQLNPEAQSREYFLPERITFVESEISGGAVEPASAYLGDAGAEWSDAVIFYPDGSASNARLVLQNEREQRIEVSLRGLTGVVTVGDVYSGAGAGL